MSYFNADIELNRPKLLLFSCPSSILHCLRGRICVFEMAGHACGQGRYPAVMAHLLRNTTAQAESVGELDILRLIRSRAARLPNARVALGIGDDCALLRPRHGEELAVTTDLSIADRHFRLDWHPPESIGHRTLARGLSDLAAMGAQPVAAFLSLALPVELTRSSSRGTSWLGRFLDGFLALAARHGVALAGGDLAQSPLAFADIVLTGVVPRGRALLRSGARAGDRVCVTGSLGGAAAELASLAAHPRRFTRIKQTGSKIKQAGSKVDGGEENRPHLYPAPRIAQGVALRRRALATAALDISDGLSTELSHLALASGVCIEIDAERIPLGPGASLDQALHGGEDYELLFTTPSGLRLPRTLVGAPVTVIGRVLASRRGQPVVTLLQDGLRQTLAALGWEHFR